MDTIKKVANAILDAGEGCQSGLVYVDPVEAAKAAIAALSTDAEPVAWGNFKDDGTLVGLAEEKNENWIGAKPLYAAPPAPSVAVKALRTAIHNGLIDGARLESDLQSEFDRTVDTILASVSATLSAQVQDLVVPEGWQLVPKELTTEMRTRLQMQTEMGAYVCENLSGAYGLMDEYHAAMIAAAPAAKLEGKP